MFQYEVKIRLKQCNESHENKGGGVEVAGGGQEEGKAGVGGGTRRGRGKNAKGGRLGGQRRKGG